MVPWICCQLGAREHYAIPRALFRVDTLDWLVTDAWVPPSSLLAKIYGRRLTDRFHNDLSHARVMAFNSSVIPFEMFSRTRRIGEWQKIVARNRWFQRKVVSFLRSQLSTLNSVKERGSRGAFTLLTDFTRRGGNAQLRKHSRAGVQRPTSND